jgi:hypothetical protein
MAIRLGAQTERQVVSRRLATSFEKRDPQKKAGRRYFPSRSMPKRRQNVTATIVSTLPSNAFVAPHRVHEGTVLEQIQHQKPDLDARGQTPGYCAWCGSGSVASMGRTISWAITFQPDGGSAASIAG